MLDLALACRSVPALVDPFLGSLVPLDRTDPLAGTFVHVAAGVKVAAPLQTFFGQQAERMAPLSRTLIVAEAGSSVAFIEGCSAPIYTPHTERRAVVEVVVGSGASARHTTIQNWSTNVVNQVEKHATVQTGGAVEWVDAVLGTRSTSTNIVSHLAGVDASASVLSMLSADSGQRHEVEVEAAHRARETSSNAVIKMLGSGDGAITSRHVAHGQVSGAQCSAHALRLDGQPLMAHESGGGAVEHLDVDPTHVRYLMRRGFSRSQAIALIVGGFIEPIARTLPMEYAVEWERLIELHLDRAIG